MNALMAGYQDALWVDGTGHTLHGGERDLAGYFPALQGAALEPRVLHDAEGRDTAWVPLKLDAGETGAVWVGRDVQHDELTVWLNALRTRLLLLVVLLALTVMLVVQRVIGWLDDLRRQTLEGVRAMLDGRDDVSFDWRGPAEMVALGRDLSELGRQHGAARKAQLDAEQRLTEEKAWAETTLRSITDGVVTTDADGRVIGLNPAAARLLRHQGEIEEVQGRRLDDLFSVVDDLTRAPVQLPALLSIAEDRAVDTGLDALLVRKDGREVPIQASAAPMHRADGMIAGAVVVMRDVAQERRLQRLLAHQASHDGLTGLANRGAFEIMLTQALAEARRHPDAGLWLCYVDLDQFKMINDTCGHQAGDQLLQQVADDLRKAVRDCDAVARMGGDEFAVLLKRCSPEGAMHIVDRMRRRLAEARFLWDGQSFLTSGSFGLVPLHAGSGSLYDLLSAADSACYIAKERGRNRIHLADGQDEAVRQFGGEIKWAHETIRALEDDRLCLYFQPIKPLKHKGGLHIEVLVRMLDTEGKLVPPGVFIPAAERYNLMRDVDRWVLRETLRNFASASADSVVSVNLSAQSLCDDEFLDFALEAIAASDIDPRILCFEVTETAAMSNLSRAQEVIRTLQAKGCRFALDDFGSGLSSFGYLKNLPIDYLKIDGSFVKNILDQPLDRAFVQSMSDLGHLMGIATIAEYVENAEVERVLVDLGVDFAQGYGIAAPRPIAVLFQELAAE
jgi:diguanylate cyclase (GGDEF)-like protein/PAS domain S-box-containing protein